MGNQFCTVISLPPQPPTLTSKMGKNMILVGGQREQSGKRDKGTADKFDYRSVGRPWIH